MPQGLKRRHETDLLIGGAGFAGLALAIALRQGLGEAFAVTVVDPALGAAQSKDPRASAIAAAARRLFEAIGVWDAVAGNAQPILDMVVTDSKLDDAVRPTFLTFGGEVEEGEPFAHMIENRHLIDALVKKAKELGVELRAGAVTGFEHTANAIDVRSPTAKNSPRGCWSAPMARARKSASRPASPRMAGTTTSRPSSRPSRMSASTTAAPRSIFCPPGRSRFCR